MKRGSSNLFRLLWPHMRPHLGMLSLIVVLGTVTALAQQSAFVLVKPTWEVLFPVETAAAQEAQQEEQAGAGEGSFTATLQEWREAGSRLVLGEDPDLADEGVRASLLRRVCLLIAIIAVLGAASSYGFSVVSRRVGLLMVVSLRLSVTRHLMGLSLRYHGERKLGDLLSRVSSDVAKAMTIANIVLRDLIQEPIMALTALAMAFVLAPEATLFVVVGLPVLMVPVAMLLKRVRRGSTRSLDVLGASVQTLAQMFTGVRTVKAFRAEERELGRYRDVNRRFVRASMKMVRAEALTRSWTLFFTQGGLAVVLLVLGWLALRDGTTQESSTLAPFFLLISRAYSSIKTTTRAWSRVAEAQGASDRLLVLLDERSDIVEQPDAIECRGLGSGIRFEGLSLHYADGEGAALDDVSLEIRPGETLALVGPSGAGKSTFVDLVARFVDPTQGRITVDGVDLRDLTLDSWMRQFAIVTQEPFLFHETIRENVLYGRPGASNEELREAARAANILEFIEGLPGGWNTNVSDVGSRLSGGQRQRITIARAILHGGELLLLDEATSALDTESETAVQTALEGMRANRTVIIIAHRLSTIRDADRIAVLEEGRLVEIGTHAELLEEGGTYARLHGLQFR